MVAVRGRAGQGCDCRLLREWSEAAFTLLVILMTILFLDCRTKRPKNTRVMTACRECRDCGNSMLAECGMDLGLRPNALRNWRHLGSGLVRSQVKIRCRLIDSDGCSACLPVSSLLVSSLGLSSLCAFRSPRATPVGPSTSQAFLPQKRGTPCLPKRLLPQRRRPSSAGQEITSRSVS